VVLETCRYTIERSVSGGDGSTHVPLPVGSGPMGRQCKNGWTDRDAIWRSDSMAQGTTY